MNLRFNPKRQFHPQKNAMNSAKHPAALFILKLLYLVMLVWCTIFGYVNLVYCIWLCWFGVLVYLVMLVWCNIVGYVSLFTVLGYVSLVYYNWFC